MTGNKANIWHRNEALAFELIGATKQNGSPALTHRHAHRDWTGSAPPPALVADRRTHKASCKAGLAPVAGKLARALRGMQGTVFRATATGWCAPQSTRRGISRLGFHGTQLTCHLGQVLGTLASPTPWTTDHQARKPWPWVTHLSGK